MALQVYYPEMGESRPATEFHARMSYFGGHYHVRSIHGPDKISGRGIEFEQQETAETLVPDSKFVGWYKYKMTLKAFDKICTQFNVATEALLD